MTLKIIGDKQWERWIDSVADDVAEEVGNHVAKTAGKIETDAKFRAPVDSGDLRRSISNKMETNKTKIMATVAPDTKYDIYVELGTSRQPAQPYLFPSFDKNTANFPKEINNIVRKVVR